MGSRELAWGLLARELRAQYRQSFLGYAWILLPTLASMMVWWFVQSRSLLKVPETSVPYPVFALAGLVFWDTFVQAIVAPMTQFQASLPMMAKIRFAHEAIGFAAIAQVGIHGLMRILLFVLVGWMLGATPGPWSLAALGPLMVVIVLGFSIGLLLATGGLLYEDLARSIPIFTGLWFILTPVVYPPSLVGQRGILALNPIDPVLQTGRSLLLGTPCEHLGASLIVCGLLSGALLAAWLLFRVAAPHLIARAGA